METTQEKGIVIKSYTKKELMQILNCRSYQSINKYILLAGVGKPAQGRYYTPKQTRVILLHFGIV